MYSFCTFEHKYLDIEIESMYTTLANISYLFEYSR